MSMCLSLLTETSVLITARRGSDGGVVQRVRQVLPDGSRVCVSRTRVGIWS